MWVIRAIFIALIVICIVAFAFYNVSESQKIDINLIFARYVEVPLVTVVFWSFVAGIIVSLMIFISSYVRLSIETRGARKKIRHLEEEVAVLRNRPIDESADLLKGADRSDADIESPFSES